LAQLWNSWDVHPQIMLGHSVGEFVAACLADVFTLEDALRLVAHRGRLMQSMPPGGMLSVRLSEDLLRPQIGHELEIAAVNAPALSVVAGPVATLEILEARLTAQGIACR